MSNPKRLTRREFIKLSGTTSLGIALSACGVAPTPTATPAPTNTPLPTNTPAPTATLIPPTTTPTLQPTATSTPKPTATLIGGIIAAPDLEKFEKDLNGQGDKMIYECSPKSLHAMEKARVMVAALKSDSKVNMPPLENLLSTRKYYAYPIDGTTNTNQAMTEEREAVFIGTFVTDLGRTMFDEGLKDELNLGKVTCAVVLLPENKGEPTVMVSKIVTANGAEILTNALVRPDTISPGSIVKIERLLSHAYSDAAFALQSGTPKPLSKDKPYFFSYSMAGKHLLKLGVLNAKDVLSLSDQPQAVQQIIDRQILQFLYRMKLK